MRHATSEKLLDYDSLAKRGVLYFKASYSEDYASDSTYPARVANYAPPIGVHTIVNTVTARHTHTPHPSKWNCPGSTPALFEEELRKAIAHIRENDMVRVVTCYNVAEWAEGGPGLQPNMQDGFAYLKAVRNAVVLPAAAAGCANNVFPPSK